MLLALGFERCILMPAADDAALWLAELPVELAERFPRSISSAASLRALQQKSTFSKLVNDLAIPAPRSFAVECESDLLNVPIEDLDALFLKPVDSQEFVAGYGKKGIWVSNREQALESLQQANNDGFELIAQEYIPGGADDHYFIDGFRDRKGVIRAKTARRRIRIFPADFGNSSYCVSVDFQLVQPAWEGLERILQHLDYRGIFSAEFKLDARDGLFKILEVNTRPWVYIEFAGICGMNMCDLYIRDALSELVPTTADYDVGRGCVDLYNDLVTVLRSPKAQRPEVMEILVAWARAFKLLFAWRDPVPALIFVGRRLNARLRRVFGN